MLRRLASAAAIAALVPTAFQIAPVSAQEAATAPEARQIEGIVAIVNDDPISISDVRERARMLLLSLGGSQPTQQQLQQITSQALDELIDEKLQLQEAGEYDVEITEAEIASAVENMARQSGTDRETLVGTLLAAGVNPSSLEDQTRAEIAWRRIMGGLYGSRIRISENQISEQIKRLKASSKETQYQLSEIFLYAPTEAEQAQALEGAKTIIEQLEAGAPFQVAAQRFSSAPTAATGGDMGWVTIKDISEELAPAVSAMSGPGLTDPIVASDGVYIMQVRNKREPSQTTSMVDVVRVSVVDGSRDALAAAVAEIGTCENIDAVVADDANLQALSLDDLSVEDLGPDGRDLVMEAPLGGATDIFPTSDSLAVMFVCDRQDNIDNVPSHDEIEDRLFAQQLGMISQRSLRNLRREATIIRRDQ